MKRTNPCTVINTRREHTINLYKSPKMWDGSQKGENPSAFGKNKIQWITYSPAGLRGRVIFGKGNEVTIGDRIRRIRKKRRLTQAELAMMSGLSLSAIQGYEQGRYEPKRKSLESIAEVFKISVYELYDTPAQHGTNLAEVGTDVHDANVGNKAQLSDKGTTFENGGEIKRWSKDIISRQAAIDAYGDWYVEEGTEEGFIGTVKQLLEGLPSAQPEPKWGTWKCSDDLYETAICSCCGYDTNEPWGWTREHFMFCPNCGEKLVR